MEHLVVAADLLEQVLNIASDLHAETCQTNTFEVMGRTPWGNEQLSSEVL